MTDETPLPCPFCGAALVVLMRAPGGNWWQHRAGDCMIAVLGGIIEEQGIAAWNARARVTLAQALAVPAVADHQREGDGHA